VDIALPARPVPSRRAPQARRDVVAMASTDKSCALPRTFSSSWNQKSRATWVDPSAVSGPHWQERRRVAHHLGDRNDNASELGAARQGAHLACAACRAVCAEAIGTTVCVSAARARSSNSPICIVFR